MSSRFHSSSSPADADFGIYTLLNTVEAQKKSTPRSNEEYAPTLNTGAPSTIPRGGGRAPTGSAVTDSYHFPPSRSSRRRSTNSSGYSSSQQSTRGSYIFDSNASYVSHGSYASVSTAFSNPDDELDPIYECEFRGIGCEAGFVLGRHREWIHHIVVEHMFGLLPWKSLCWFCSKSFTADPRREHGRKEAFESRMLHIANHIRTEGRTRRRPDHDLNEFLIENKLVPDPESYEEAARTYHEAPQPMDMEMMPESPNARRRRPGEYFFEEPESYEVALQGNSTRRHRYRN